ncbi:MAG: sulfatase [Planctomycetota bacterium]
MRDLRIPLVALLVMSLCGSVCSAADTDDPKPNIVLIISDDQAWTDYGFMGHDAIHTPHLDRLAEQSVLFRRGYVPTALCRPSLMTLATGRYAHEHGVTGNDPSPKYADRNSDLYAQRRAKLISYIDRFETLPELLVERGYLCHQSGKWWEGSYKRGGFTHGMTRGFPNPGGRHGDVGLKIGREGLEPVTEFVDMAVEKEKPFFLWYAPFLPHTPHNPPERLLSKYEKEGRPLSIARYYAMCEWFDETCGELLGHLDKKGLRENTLVVYVTDNGWIQNPKGGGYAPRSKQTPYEGGVRTPIMFSWPKTLKSADRPELVSSIDLIPTILAAAGARIPGDLPGLNLLPNLEAPREIEREALFGEGFAHDIADIDNPEASLLYRWCIEGKWKLILTYDGEVNRYQSTHPRTQRGPQLFDLLADPHEQRNVAAEHPEVVARLAERIADWYPVTERKTRTSPTP